MANKNKTRINIYLSPYEGDDFPDADDLYEDFVLDAAHHLYPDAEIDVVTRLGKTEVFVYVDGKPADFEGEEMTAMCEVDWWEEFCNDHPSGS